MNTPEAATPTKKARPSRSKAAIAERAAAAEAAKKAEPKAAPAKPVSRPKKEVKAAPAAPAKKAAKPSKAAATPAKIVHPARVTKKAMTAKLIEAAIAKAGGVDKLDRAKILDKMVTSCQMTDTNMASTYYHNHLRSRT